MDKPDAVFPRSGTKFICELPSGDGEWRMMPFTGHDGKRRIIVINPNHPPYVLEDGVATQLIFDAGQGANHGRGDPTA